MDRRSGIELCAAFYHRQVRPALAAAHPRLRHAAALMGRGSEVLGYDDAMSSDHDWAARVIVLLDPADAGAVDPVGRTLRETVPTTFDGVPTDVEVTTVADYVQTQLGLDVSRAWDVHDWLSLPEHRLGAFTGGAVFHDEVGLADVRDRLGYYPRDVWYYLLAAAWWRVHPEVNLVGRSGHAGDELGSALIAADLVGALMHLAFLVERRYAPYRKWFGTAFSRLDVAPALAPDLARVLSSATWQEREGALNDAYATVADAYDGLRITDPQPLEPVRLWQRPFTVPWTDYPSALVARIEDPLTRDLARAWPPATGIDRVREILWAARSRPAVRQLVRHQAGTSLD